MQTDLSSGGAPAEGSSVPSVNNGPWPEGTPTAGTEPERWTSLVARNRAAKERISQLAHTIDVAVIPRLAEAHRIHHDGQRPVVGAADVQQFVELLLAERHEAVLHTVEALRQRGLLVESLYLDFLAPAARLLGDMWLEDRCDFATVTWAVGRLHSVMRELGPAFASEVQLAPNGRRVLFAQPPGEQHSFGLSMLADFFRRHGWEVMGGVGGTVADPARLAREQFVDVVGLSTGSETRLPWLAQCVAEIRAGSCNPNVVVLVGGPIFTLHPQWAADVGADATAPDAIGALRQVEKLLPVPAP